MKNLAYSLFLLALAACGSTADETPITNTSTAETKTLPALPQPRPLREMPEGFYLDSIVYEKIHEKFTRSFTAWFPQSKEPEYAFLSETIKTEVEKFFEKEKADARLDMYAKIWVSYFHLDKKKMSICLSTVEDLRAPDRDMFYGYVTINQELNGRIIHLSELFTGMMKSAGLPDKEKHQALCDSLNPLPEISQTEIKLMPLNFTNEQPYVFVPGGLQFYLPDLWQKGHSKHDSIFVPERIVENRLSKTYFNLTKKN